MRFTLAEVAAAVGGRLGTGAEPGAVIDGATQDSRAVRPGVLFVPIVAARDGHDFVADALAGGAAGYLTARTDLDGPAAIHVADTMAALERLASAARDRITGPVVAITGSAGKTSTKDLTRSILERRGPVVASEKSFNNEIGVPLTLVNGPDDAWAAVVEIGARFPGNIAAGCVLCRPTVGVVTNVGTAHLETFGSRAAIAATKGEIVIGLDASGLAVLHDADEFTDEIAGRTNAAVIRFGESPRADVRASAISIDGALRPRFRLESPWGATDLQVGAAGRHQVANALAAAAAAGFCGATIDEIAAGLADPVMSPWRTEVVRLANGAVVVNDAYNANPDAMISALSGLAALDATRRIAVLGTMAELGADSAALHRGVAHHARSLGIRVISVSEDAYGLDTADVHEGIDATLHALTAIGVPGPGDAVLVKGSRVAGLERLALRLMEPTS